MDLDAKLGALKDLVADTGGLAVAYSGGVDSTLLLAVAADVLGERVLAVTADSATLARPELERARRVAASLGVRHVVAETDEMSHADFRANPPERCFICKRRRMERLVAFAREQGFAHVADGENADDSKEHRPGSRATAEIGILKPLAEAGLTKEEIRELSRRMGLETAELPSNACLATRLPHGDEITEEKLARIEAAEEFLRGLGLGQVRVRCHGEVARIEAEAGSIEALAGPETRLRIAARLHELGFAYVSLDLDGYRSGSMSPVPPEEAPE